MNRSFSKIRHIQEANQRLEKRLMSEQRVEYKGQQINPGDQIVFMDMDTAELNK
jgi:ASC-1-like (ASCH) protein